MRRILVLALALLLCAVAQGEVSDVLSTGVTTLSDLDGDGVAEAWVWEMVENKYEQHLRLTVTADEGRGASATYDTWIMDNVQLMAVDLDGDGRLELLASGDVMSDDYYTWCLHWQNGAIYDVVFADAERGENTMGYFTSGYGQIEALVDGVLTLSGSQDVLGTWFGSRDFRLMPNGRFEFADDGWWVRRIDAADAALWEYAALTPKVDIPCRIDGAAAVLKAGEKCVITGSDKLTEAAFITQDGRNGVFAIEADWQRGWGSMIDGVSEEALFEYVPYAD